MDKVSSAQKVISSIQDQIDAAVKSGNSTDSISDGYHSFSELYECRNVLFITLCKQLANDFTQPYISDIWKSMCHSDGTRMDGWFVMGIGEEHGKIMTFHLPMKFWVDTNFATELERAVPFDGHTTADVLERLMRL